MSQLGLDLMCMLPDEVGYRVLIASWSVSWSGAPTFPISTLEYAPAASMTWLRSWKAVRAATRGSEGGVGGCPPAWAAPRPPPVPLVSAEILIPFGFA